VLRSAAASIGLKPTLKSVSAQNYINFFVDPKAREGVDGFFTVNYPDYADPSGLYGTLAVPGGSQNYAGYNNPQVTQLFNEARTTADPDQRAEKVAQAQAIISQELPWIPMSDPYSLLVMNKRITGAPASFVYMDAPWAASIGAAP
jgi:peptide/nickel transport system substrate-binding protein